jgi:hypothetical protein
MMSATMYKMVYAIVTAQPLGFELEGGLGQTQPVQIQFLVCASIGPKCIVLYIIATGHTWIQTQS